MISATWQNTTVDATFTITITGIDKRALEDVAVAWGCRMSEALEPLIERALRDEQQAIKRQAASERREREGGE